MLSLSNAAADALRGLLSAQGAPRGRALRIVERPLDDGRSALMLALSTPRDSDLSIRNRGLEVFVETAAAQRLDGKLLHALADGRRVRFVLAPDPAANA